MSPPLPDPDSLKNAINFSQNLSQWSVLILGGSVAALIGTSNWRPARVWVRRSYLLFLPAWVLLFASSYHGVAAQRNCLALMLLANADTNGAKIELNRNLYAQLQDMQISFCFLGLWLTTFLLWWIFDASIDPDRKG